MDPDLMPPPLPKRASVGLSPTATATAAATTTASSTPSPSHTPSSSHTPSLPLPHTLRNSMAGDNIPPPPTPPRQNTSNSPSLDDLLQHSTDALDTKPLLPPRPPDQTSPPAATETLLNNPGSLPSNRRAGSPEQPPTAARQASMATNASSSTRHLAAPSPTDPAGSGGSKGRGKVANEEIAFQFDRHVQEIRRRRTVAKGPPKPDPENFTTVEAESGKRVLNVPHYIQAYLAYFIESLARDEKTTRKPEALQWSRIRAILSRLYDSSSPAQSFGLYVERVMYWENPPETVVWLTIYSVLWYNQLWLPGFLTCLVLKMLNNRFMILGNLHQALNVPLSLNERVVEQQQHHRSTKMRSQLHQLIASRDLTDWLMTVMKIWGPYLQTLAEDNIGYLERLKNLMRWERPHQTWRVIGLLMFYIIVSAFFSYLVLPAIGFAIGVEYFFLLPLQSKYPRWSHLFSPLEWILWGVPTDTELAVERLTKQQEDQIYRLQQQQQQQPLDEASSEHSDAGSNTQAPAERPDLHTMSPASRIKYEYQNRSSPNHSAGSSSTSVHSATSEAPSLSGTNDKTEYHCMLRGKPGKLVIHEDNIQFRSAKLLGRDVEAVIPWDMIDTIKKTKTMSIGLWSTPGIEVIDINGRQTTFQNVVHRDDAFRKLVLTSGKKWASVQ